MWQKLHQLTPYSAKMATSQANNVGRTSELHMYVKGRFGKLKEGSDWGGVWGSIFHNNH